MRFRLALWLAAAAVVVGAALLVGYRKGTVPGPSDEKAVSDSKMMLPTDVRTDGRQGRQKERQYRSTKPSSRAELERQLLLAMTKGLQAARNREAGGHRQTPQEHEDLSQQALQVSQDDQDDSAEWLSPGRPESKALLQDRWASESMDTEWTWETEQALSEMIRDADIGATVEQVECATTICRSEIHFEDVDGALKLREFAGDPIADVKFYPGSPKGGEGGVRVVLFMARPGRKLESIIGG